MERYGKQNIKPIIWENAMMIAISSVVCNLENVES